MRHRVHPHLMLQKCGSGDSGEIFQWRQIQAESVKHNSMNQSILMSRMTESHVRLPNGDLTTPQHAFQFFAFFFCFGLDETRPTHRYVSFDSLSLIYSNQHFISICIDSNKS